MNIFHTTFLAIVLGTFFSVAGFGQGETQPVDRSSLVGVRLPAGAERVNEASVPAEINNALEQVVTEGGGKVRRGDTEVLLWTGSDLKKAGSKAIVSRLTGALAAEGWQYEVSGTANGITFFTLLKDGANRRAVFGLHGEADGTLLFALTELHSANSAQPASSSTISTNGGTVSDYSFTTPSGWSRSDSAAKITLTSKDGEKSVTFLPLVDSSGSLDREAERLLWQVYKGHGPWSGNGFTPDYGVFERGRTAQGLEYYRAYRYAKRLSDDDPFPQSRFDANILLVKLGSKVAVIVGRSPFQSDYANDSAGSAIDLILYDLKFKSVNQAYDLKSEMLGSWSAASSSVAIAYTFNANGTFNKGGAISFRTRHDDTRDKVTTSSYGMSDKYSLAGNTITQSYMSTGEVSKFKVRVYETKYDKDPWQAKMGFLSVANPDGGTIVFRKSE